MMRLREGLQLHPLWGPHRHARWAVLLHRLRGQRRGAHDRMLQLVGSRWSLRLWAPQLRAGSASESGFGCVILFHVAVARRQRLQLLLRRSRNFLRVRMRGNMQKHASLTASLCCSTSCRRRLA